MGDNAYLICLPSDLKISPMFNVVDRYPYFLSDAAPATTSEFKDKFSFVGEELMKKKT